MNRINFTFAHITRIAALAALLATGHGAQAAQIESWSFGCSNPGHMSSGNGGGAGKASYDLKKNVKRGEAPSTTEQACDVSTPRDPASGQATGKRQHSPITISR